MKFWCYRIINFDLSDTITKMLVTGNTFYQKLLVIGNTFGRKLLVADNTFYVADRKMTQIEERESLMESEDNAAKRK